MEIILVIALLMIWIALTVLVAMTYFGYDVRSRGFTASGPAVATLPKLEIGIQAYFKKRNDHPVCDESLLPKVRLYKALTMIFIVLFIVFVVLAIVL